MTVTFSFQDLLLFVLAAVALTALVYFVVVLRRLSQLLGEWRRLASRAEGVMPRIERVLDSAEGTITAARRVVEIGGTVVQDLAAVSGSVRSVAQETIDQVAVALAPVRYLAAFVTGLRRALESLLLGAAANPKRDKEDSDEERDL